MAAIGRQMALQTSAITACILAVTLVTDAAINVWLMPGVAPYTPLATALIVLLIAPPFVLAMLMRTEQVRKAEEALAREHAARLAAEATNRARSRFLANATHELRTPLNAITGYSALMLEDAEAQAREQDAADHRRVIAAANRLLLLVNDILDLSRIEAGKMQIEIGALDVKALLAECIDVVRPIAERNRNSLTCTIEDGLEAVHSDALRLSQCLINLLSNAAKFTVDGQINVSVRRVREQAGGHLAFEVRDSGMGIAPDAQVFLFEPFMRVETACVSSVEGSGLGLAITRQIARLLGGDVTMTSTLGGGSCFTLTTPFHVRPSKHEDADDDNAALCAAPTAVAA